MAFVPGTNKSDYLDADDGVTNAADTILGYGGPDVIFGLGGADIIRGGYGDDILIGGAGGDTLDGGDDTDTASYYNSASGVIANLASGTGSSGDAFGDRYILIEGLIGSRYNDVLIGDDNNNMFEALHGADVVKGGGGDDTIWGGDGADDIFGGNNNDVLRGGAGADDINGGAGVDHAKYEDSAVGVVVTLTGAMGTGGTAQGDTLVAVENLTGSYHNDVLIGDNNENTLDGLDGVDHLKGGGGDDTLNGDNGNDVLKGGGGEDILNGGAGIDTADYYWSAAGVTVYLINDTASDGEAQDDDLNSIENLSGSGHNDDLWGSNGANVLRGMNGVDTLKGFGGADTLEGGNHNDTLNGGTGIDAMDGGLGHDTFFVDNAGDDVFEAAGQGDDIVRATVSYQLDAGQEIEHLTTTSNNGVGAINLTGNAITQTIVGNAGANVLRGLGGDDHLYGMAGHDTLTGGAGEDKFLFNSAPNAATNVDTITDFSVVDDVIRLDDNFFARIGRPGVLNVDAFHIGAAAADAEDRIIYNSVTGELFFDSNGGAAGGSVLFARLATGLALTNADFHVV